MKIEKIEQNFQDIENINFFLESEIIIKDSQKPFLIAQPLTSKNSEFDLMLTQE